MVCGTTEASTDFLTQASRELNVEHKFPQPSDVLMPINLTISVPHAAPGAPARVEIQILDSPGESFMAQPWRDRPRMETAKALDYLTTCAGLIYFLDLERELGAGNSYAHFEHILLRIAQQWAARSRAQDPRLPHYLAVCAIKYDAPTYFVTSAVGVWVWNSSPNGERGAIHPIGVAEPLLWLGEKLAARKDIFLT